MSNVIALPPPKPVAPAAGIESGYLLTPPAMFEGYAVVASFYERPHNGYMHGHLVVFHMHPGIGETPAVIARDAPVFGIGHIEYDDAAEDVVTRRLADHVTYAQAFDFLAQAMLRAVS